SFACAKPREEPVTHQPEHGHHHHGHHDHGHGHGVNEHGYKGHRFDDPEQWMQQFESPERTAWQKPDEVVASLALAPDATIADLGAGTGYFTIRFAAAVPSGKVYAVDIEPSMVAWLSERAQKQGLANVEAIRAEPDDPRLPGPVDVVFMCNVFHHLADPQAYFEAVAGKLEAEGRVVIVDFRKDNPDDAPGPPAHMRMTAEQVVEIMRAAGYQLRRHDRELLQYQYLLEFTLQ
ncbi:MAG TPA: methyltransferase domain-containing protein, partial [Enhygromyxa sp.]|nr:methyltransferase domain-containing protein [Enhygromyxa sp.]